MTDQQGTQQDPTLREHDANVGIDWGAIWDGLRTPAALRGLAVLGVGVVGLAVPELSTWLLSLLIGIVLVIAGGLEGFAALQKRPIDWPDAGRSLLLILGGVALLALRRLGESSVATLVGLVIGLRGMADLYGTWRRRHELEDVGWHVTRGLAQVLLGVLIAVSDGTLLVILVVILAVAWIVAGAIAVVEAIQRDDDPDGSGPDTENVVLEWLHSRDMGAKDREAVVDKVIFEGDAAKGRISRFIVITSNTPVRAL